MEARFECKHCLKKFKSRESRHHHLSKYHGYEPISYKCTHCPKTFKYKHNYITHLSDGHKVPNMRFECGQCTSSFKYSHHLVQHMRLVHDPDKKTYKCKECSKTFERRDAFVQHMRIHAPTVTLHRCDLCQRMYRSKAGLTLHVNMNHNENFQRSQCPWCPSDFKWPHHLKQHISKVHFRPDESLSDMKYSKNLGNRCGLCMVSFPSKLDLLMHLKTHHNLDVDIYKCCQCTEVFNLKEPLQLHLEKHQEREEFTHKCEQCHPMINPKLYIDKANDQHDADYEAAPSDEVTDFEVCIMEHPELRRMIKYKMRHAKTNEPFFSGGHFEAESENEEDYEWPLAESTNYDYNDDNESNITPEVVPEIGVIAAIPDASATTNHVRTLNELSNDAMSETSEYTFNLPEGDNSNNSVCQFPCDKCEASLPTADYLSEHNKIHYGLNSQASVQESLPSIEMAIQGSDSIVGSNEVSLDICESPIGETLIHRLQESVEISIGDIQVPQSIISSIQEPTLNKNSSIEVSPEKSVNRSSSSCNQEAVVKDGSDKKLVVKLLRLNQREILSSSDQIEKQLKNVAKNKKCSKCTTVFDDTSSLKRHEKEIHSKEKLIFKCEICNKFFANKSQLDKHLINHKPEIVISKPSNDLNDKPCNELSDKPSNGFNDKIQEAPLSPNGKKDAGKSFPGKGILNHIKCKQCNLTFDTGVEIARHVRLSHKRARGAHIRPKAKQTACKQCSKIFAKPLALAFHARIHHKKPAMIHLKNDSEEIHLHIGNDSNHDFNENSLINTENSARINNAGEPSPLLTPERVQLNGTDAEESSPEIGNQSDKQPDVYECGKCELFFKTKLELLRHISGKHMNIKDVNSKKYAAFKTTNSADAGSGNSEMEIMTTENSHIMPHYCIACDQLFSTESDHIRHMKMEHRHRCGICGIAYVHKEKLRKHMETQHKGRPQQHKCDECDAVFRLEASLAKHMDEKHLKLASQGKTGATEPQLVTREMEKAMHKCVHCSALFPLRESLQRHIQMEHDIGSLHKCGECTAVFNDIEEFKEHLQIEHMQI